MSLGGLFVNRPFPGMRDPAVIRRGSMSTNIRPPGEAELSGQNKIAASLR